MKQENRERLIFAHGAVETLRKINSIDNTEMELVFSMIAEQISEVVKTERVESEE